MKISEKWLREWVQFDADTDELARQLIMAGTELDGINPVASAFTNVVVGQIKSIEQHPDADRLRVCQVDVGAEEQIQIVTNATVVVDQKVPVAMIGANLPEADGSVFKIKKSKLRGVLSQGMFCGSETLGLGDTGEGLQAIPDSAELGADVRVILDLEDVVLDLDATPNRADLLSVAGVAREVGVLMQASVIEPQFAEVAINIPDVFSVSIEADNLCQRYVGRIIRDVDTQVPTPDWIKEKLRRSDIRSLGAVVDITNYVMIELGQPLHGFDFDTLQGGIVVRNAQQDEKLTLLDGREISLRPDTLVIADQNKAVALAGIMGGNDTAVGDVTCNIYLESAFFVPEKIMGKARSYGLHTDSSHRFERGVSPDLQRKAIERASQLILEICGGQAGEVTDVIANVDLLKQAEIKFEKARIKRHLGIEIDDQRVEDILSRLGCSVTYTENGWIVIPPVFRFDLATQEDLIEEIARIYGYDNIPARLRPMQPLITQKAETRVCEDALYNILIEQGYREAITYSFVPPEVEALLSPDSEKIRLSNPISDELSIMRSSLWSGLIPALDKNVKRQQSRVRLFESGLSFLKTADGRLTQRKKLAGVITGPLYSEQWGQDSRWVDFFDLKGDVEVLLNQASAQTFEFVRTNHAALHPGQSAKILCGDKTVGFCGALHPAVEKKLDLDQTVFVFELDIDYISEKVLPVNHSLSRYPSIRRDLSLLIVDTVSYEQISKAIRDLKINELIDFQVFDVYMGEKLDSGQKSLALSLIFQEFSRTLEEAEVAGFMERIVTSLKNDTGAMLR